MTRSIWGNYRAMKLDEIAAWDENGDVIDVLWKIKKTADAENMWQVDSVARAMLDAFKYRNDYARDDVFGPSQRVVKQILNHALGLLQDYQKRNYRYDQGSLLSIRNDVEKRVLASMENAWERMKADADIPPAPSMHESTISEAKSLMGKNLVNYLTIICMDSWYALQRKFSGSPDTFDVHQAESENPDFEVFKMTPGVDKRDQAFEYIMSAASQLTKALNSAFGKEVFEQRVSRTSGTLQVLVAFSAGKGGVFQCKAENNTGGNTTIVLTMPNHDELVRAFSAMTDTPHPKDEMLPADDFEAPDVAGRAVPKPAGAVDAMDRGETGDPSPDPGGPIPDPIGSPEEDPTRIPRFESAQPAQWKVTWTVGGKQNYMIVNDPTVKTAEEAVRWVTLRDRRARGGNPVAAQIAGVVEDVTVENFSRGLRRAAERAWFNPNKRIGSTEFPVTPTGMSRHLASMNHNQLSDFVERGRGENPNRAADLHYRLASRKLRQRALGEEVAANSSGDAAQNIAHQPTDGGHRKFMRRWKDAGKGFGWGNPFADETGGNDSEYE